MRHLNISDDVRGQEAVYEITLSGLVIKLHQNANIHSSDQKCDAVELGYIGSLRTTQGILSTIYWT